MVLPMQVMLKKKQNKTWTAKNGIQPATYEEWIVQQLQQ